MKSIKQADHLKQTIDKLVKEHGAENPYVRGLMDQLANLQRSQNSNQQQFQVGMQAPLR